MQSEKKMIIIITLFSYLWHFEFLLQISKKAQRGKKREKKSHIKRNIIPNFHYSNSTAFLSKYVLYANTLTQQTRRKEI